MNSSAEEIKDLVKSKLAMYGEDFKVMHIHDIKLSHNDFIYDNIKTRYYPNQPFEIYQYIGMKNGTEMYRFYNIII